VASTDIIPDGHDWLALLTRAHREFTARLDAVTDWHAPTPDTGWTVQDLVSHVVEEQQWIPHLLGGRSVGETRARIDPLEGDLRAEWHRYSLSACAAWQAASLESTVTLSYGTVTIDEYLREQVSDVTIHSWDLARAVGADERLDDDLVAGVWTVFEPQKDTLSASGLFASPVRVPDDAPLQYRLLALTGRSPYPA
jgi:uncharacterized protein (TIGR03086 family)